MGEKTYNLKRGLVDGIPIALGYFAVAFTLGIEGKNAGLEWFQTTLMSAINYTSAGEAAAISIMKTGGSYVELVVSTLIINLRYLLMSAALTSRLSPKTTNGERLLMGMGITDEIFGISIAQRYPLSAFYIFGAMLIACPGWALGTAFGGIMGQILPSVVSSSLSIALYAMFIAIIIPPAKENKVVAVLVIISMVLSYLFTKISFLSHISIGMKVIILTILLSSLAAILFPVEEEKYE